jgi:hypothetical protein
MTYISFKNAEMQAIKEFIESYFVNRVIDTFAFNDGRPFAVHYKDEWIIRGSGALCEYDGFGCVRLLDDDNNRLHSWTLVGIRDGFQGSEMPRLEVFVALL